MSEVLSTRILPLGSPAPAFTLPTAGGIVETLADVRGPKGLVVAFLCNHCPYVIHIARELSIFAATCEAKGIGFVGINSNDAERYPADSPSLMRAMSATHEWVFPYLHDESQSVAHAYHAACTPDFYVFDATLRLTYCGQFDDSRPGNRNSVTGNDLRQAVAAVLAGNPPLAEQRPSVGCNIKWKPGNEPNWFATSAAPA